MEFGGFGLTPADKVKQGQKSLVGGMVVVPTGATIAEDANQHAQATDHEAAAPSFRDFMLVMTKNLNHYYGGDGQPVEHMNGEAVGIPEDSAGVERHGAELRHRTAVVPLRHRSRRRRSAAPAAGAGCYGGVPNANEAYSNAARRRVDPATPVFIRRSPARRCGSTRRYRTARRAAATLAFHGHVWQRDPYVCPGESERHGLTGVCEMTTVGSLAIGDNPIGFAQGAQESNTPMSHFTYRLPEGGRRRTASTGDYLFRDSGSFGNASGLWGILRVDPAAP